MGKWQSLKLVKKLKRETNKLPVVSLHDDRFDFTTVQINRLRQNFQNEVTALENEMTGKSPKSGSKHSISGARKLKFLRPTTAKSTSSQAAMARPTPKSVSNAQMRLHSAQKTMLRPNSACKYSNLAIALDLIQDSGRLSPWPATMKASVINER